MIRHRLHSTVTLGRMNDALQWARDMNEVARKNHWVEARVMMPGFGQVNGFIFETEYPDLAALQKQDEAFYADAEAMSVFRRATELNAPGTHPWDELEVSAPDRLA